MANLSFSESMTVGESFLLLLGYLNYSSSDPKHYSIPMKDELDKLELIISAKVGVHPPISSATTTGLVLFEKELTDYGLEVLLLFCSMLTTFDDSNTMDFHSFLCVLWDMCLLSNSCAPCMLATYYRDYIVTKEDSGNTPISTFQGISLPLFT